MRADALKADAVQIIHGRTHADGCGNRRRSRLEFIGNGVVSRFFEGDAQYHIAAALERLHFFQKRALAVKHADAGRPAYFMAGKSIKIAIERLHVELEVRRRLRSVEQYRHAPLVRGGNHLTHRVHRAQRIRDMRKRYELGALVEKLFIFTEQNFAGVVDGRDAQFRTFFLAQHLPRHDIRMVLQPRNDYLVAGLDESAAIAVHHQIDALGGAAREDDFVLVFGVDEALRLVPCFFELRGGVLAQGMHRTMNIGVLLGLIPHQPVDHGLRHLAACGIVQIHQRLAVDMARKNREIRTYARHIQQVSDCILAANRGGLVHVLSLNCVFSITVWRNCLTSEATGILSMISAAKA